MALGRRATRARGERHGACAHGSAKETRFVERVRKRRPRRAQRPSAPRRQVRHLPVLRPYDRPDGVAAHLALYDIPCVCFDHAEDPRHDIFLDEFLETEILGPTAATTCKPHPVGEWAWGRAALLALGETSKDEDARSATNSARRAEKTGNRPGRSGRVDWESMNGGTRVVQTDCSMNAISPSSRTPWRKAATRSRLRALSPRRAATLRRRRREGMRRVEQKVWL